MDEKPKENEQVAESVTILEKNSDPVRIDENSKEKAMSIVCNSNLENELESNQLALDNEKKEQDRVEQIAHVRSENSSEQIESSSILEEINENAVVTKDSTTESKTNENPSWAQQLSLDEILKTKQNMNEEKYSDSEYEDIDDDDDDADDEDASEEEKADVAVNKNLNQSSNKNKSEMIKSNINMSNEKKETDSKSLQEKTTDRPGNRLSGKQQRRIKEKEKDPSVIPKKGLFYEHDYRDFEEENEVVNKISIATDLEQTAPTMRDGQEGEQDKKVDTEKVTVESSIIGKSKPVELLNRSSNKPSEISHKNNKNIDTERWAHDRFDMNEQKPKSSQDLINRYGYDIRQETSIEAIKQVEGNQDNVKTQRRNYDKKQTNTNGNSSKRTVTKENKDVSNSGRNNNNISNNEKNHHQHQQPLANRRPNYINKRQFRERLTQQRPRVYENIKSNEKMHSRQNNKQSQSINEQRSVRRDETNIESNHEIDEYEDYEDEENEEDCIVKQVGSIEEEEENSDDEARKLAFLRRRKAPVQSRLEHSDNKNFETINQQYKNNQTRTNYFSSDRHPKNSNRDSTKEYKNSAYNSREDGANGEFGGSYKVRSFENNSRNRNQQFNRQNSHQNFYRSDRHSNVNRNDHLNYDEHDNRTSEGFSSQPTMNRLRSNRVYFNKSKNYDMASNSNQASNRRYEETSHSQIKAKQQANEIQQQHQSQQDFPKRYSSLRSNQTSGNGPQQQRQHQMEPHAEQHQQQTQSHVQNQFSVKPSSSYNFQAQQQYIYQTNSLNNQPRQQQASAQQNWHPQTNKPQSQYGHMHRSLMAASQQPASAIIMQTPPGLTSLQHQHQHSSSMPRHQIYYVPSNEYEYASIAAAAVMSNPIYYAAAAGQSGSLSTPSTATQNQPTTQLSPSAIQHLQRQSKAIPIINPNKS
jgi:hypothetical protein